MTPRAWLLHTEYPVALLEGPIEGGVERTPLFDAAQAGAAVAQVLKLEGMANDRIAAICAAVCRILTEHP